MSATYDNQSIKGQDSSLLFLEAIIKSICRIRCKNIEDDQRRLNFNRYFVVVFFERRHDCVITWCQHQISWSFSTDPSSFSLLRYDVRINCTWHYYARRQNLAATSPPLSPGPSVSTLTADPDKAVADSRPSSIKDLTADLRTRLSVSSSDCFMSTESN